MDFVSARSEKLVESKGFQCIYRFFVNIYFFLQDVRRKPIFGRFRQGHCRFFPFRRQTDRGSTLWQALLPQALSSTVHVLILSKMFPFLKVMDVELIISYPINTLNEVFG